MAKVVSLQARRDAVAFLKTDCQLSEWRACGLVNISTSALRYQSRAQANGPLQQHISVLDAQRRRFGYRRIHVSVVLHIVCGTCSDRGLATGLQFTSAA